MHTSRNVTIMLDLLTPCDCCRYCCSSKNIINIHVQEVMKTEHISQ